MGFSTSPVERRPASRRRSTARPAYTLRERRAAVAVILRAIRREGGAREEAREYRSRFPDLDKPYWMNGAQWAEAKRRW